MTDRDGADAPGGPPARDRDNSWLLVSVLTLIYTCAFVDRQILALLAEPIKADLGVTDFQLSLLLGLAFSLFYGVLNVPAGLLVDRIGRRGLIGGASFVWSAMTMLCGLAGSFAQLFVARAGVGISEAFVTPASFSLIRDRVPPARRARAFSFLGMAPFVGSSVALTGGAALIVAATRGSFAGWPLIGALRPWQVVMVVVGGLGAPLPLLLLLLRPDRRGAAHRPGGRHSGFGDAFRYMRTKAGIYAALIGYVTIGSAITFGKSAWTPAMLSRKFDLATASVGYTLGPIYLLSGVTGLFLTGLLIDRTTARGGNVVKLAAWIMLGCAIFSAAPQMVRSLPLAWFLFAIGNLFSGAFYAIGATLLARVTPAALMGKITAIYLLFQNLLGAALGPSVVALLGATLFTGPLAIAHALALYFLVGGLFGLALLYALHRSSGRAPGGHDDAP